MVEIAKALAVTNGAVKGAPAVPATVTRTRPKEVPAHGGELVNRLVRADEAADVLLRARELPPVRLDARTAADAELIATGALSPLDGFVKKDDYFAILRGAHLADGPVFPVPIALGVPRAAAGALREGREAALVDATGRTVGTIAVDELYDLDRGLEARHVYGTTDTRHPGVAWLVEHQDEVGIGGRITLARRTIARRFPRHHRDPAEVRAIIAARGWRSTAAFQARNPVHRADEHLLRCALEITDGVVVHPLVGETRGDEVPSAARVHAFEALLDQYLPRDRTLLSVFPLETRHAGPREVLLHAMAGQNYGFSHFIAGGAHAGVGDDCGAHDAQRVLDALAPGELAIQTLFFEQSFDCRASASVVEP